MVLRQLALGCLPVFSFLTSLRPMWCLLLSSVSAVDLALVTGGGFGCEWVGGGLEAACGELSGTVNPHLEPQLPVCLADELSSHDSL